MYWIILFIAGLCQTSNRKMAIPDAKKKIQLVEMACGQCKFALPGKSCDLAVRINGKAYFADGAKIDSFGDAHNDDGFCNAIRLAEVQGSIVKNRFKISYVKLLPSKQEKAL